MQTNLDRFFESSWFVKAPVALLCAIIFIVLINFVSIFI